MTRCLSHFLFLSLFLLNALPLFAGSSGSNFSLWTLHLSYHEATKTVAHGSKVYALYGGNLLMYDVADQSTTTFDKLTGLTGTGISQMEWCNAADCLVLLYENNDIDLLQSDGTVTNIPQIKNYTTSNITPTNLSVNGKWCAVSTTEGVIVLDLIKQEIRGYYQLDERITDAFVASNQDVYVSTASSIKRGRLTDNLYDPSQWTTSFNFPARAFVPDGESAFVIAFGSGIPSEYSGLCHLTLPADGETQPTLFRNTTTWFDNGFASEGRFYFHGSGKVVQLDDITSSEDIQSPTTPITVRSAAHTSDGTFWLVDYNGSLTAYALNADGTALEEKGISIGNFGPLKDICFRLKYMGDRLLVTGGRYEYTSPATNYEPAAMFYENGNWHFLPTNFTLNDNALYRNVTDFIQDPADASHHFVSCSSGLLEFRDFKFVQHYNASNSTLEGADGTTSPNYCIVDALAFDASGNLWVANYVTPNTYKILLKDGTWTSLVNENYSNIGTPDRTYIDSRGYIWASTRRTSNINNAGLFGLNTHGTPADDSDDESYYRTNMTNEDGTSLSLGSVYDICEDRNGQIWFGTDAGVLAVENPEEWFGNSWLVYQPKVPRNDGTNYADYLLTGIDVTAIAVDGANRKWLGTLGSGVYLVSPDGSEILEHFTADATPLLSDNIQALAISPQGELMIGTDVGICSYRTGVVVPEGSLNKNNVKIYPNPVRPEYSGNVYITGITEGAEVKIVTAGSQLVARLSAVGGTCQWDGNSQASGERVASGVYYILIATADGKQSVAGKLVVI